MLSPTGRPSTSPMGSVRIGHPAMAGAEVTMPPVNESPPSSTLRQAGPYAGAIRASTPCAKAGVSTESTAHARLRARAAPYSDDERPLLTTAASR